MGITILVLQSKALYQFCVLQIGGIRFLFDNLVESLERYKTSNGFGCILAHSMGLGKTIQIVAFTDVFLRYTGANNVLIIVPVNTLQNWVSEFNHWLPPTEMVSPDMTQEQVMPRSFPVHIVTDNVKTNVGRAKVISKLSTQVVVGIYWDNPGFHPVSIKWNL